jgi:hypothetical protein
VPVVVDTQPEASKNVAIMNGTKKWKYFFTSTSFFITSLFYVSLYAVATLMSR